MRQRKLKDLDERMARVDHWIVKRPEENKGNWKDYFKNDKDIYLEIGCGKGQFINNHAIESPENNYLALEGQESVIVRAMDKAEENKLENLGFLSVYMLDICDYFADDELAGIYLNFSDPWPKARHAKRRLTHRDFLSKYAKVIKPGGFIEIKTDNDGLYEFTIEEINDLKMEILEETTDLHKTSFVSKLFMTEYEEKFSGRGKNINYVKVRVGVK
ncbi:MAG: tRNA (guanosine(46)-N7)-methyltransferase TrmB [Anaerovoracaceae bacterium]